MKAKLIKSQLHIYSFEIALAASAALLRPNFLRFSPFLEKKSRLDPKKF
jgi:hypothetical protein